MKILAFTDHHANDKSFQSVKKKAESADMVICCGDFTWYGGMIEKILLQFNKLRKPVIIIPGNHEEGEPVEEMCEELDNVINAHERIITTDSFSIFGYGGGGFTKQDERLEVLTKKVKESIEKLPLIMITHAPPHGTNVDKIPRYGHVGNKSINYAIKELKPLLLLCGHIHETFSRTDKLGDTIIINPGPNGKIIDIDNLKKLIKKN
ncbi:MAG: metallophosphoesterase [Nanoarchaeota archaeon]